MAATPEARVKAKVRAILKAHDIYYTLPIGSGYGGDAGTPDILACVNGLFLAIECKAGRGKTTALQDAHIERIKASGGIALVINETNLQELEQAICTMQQMR